MRSSGSTHARGLRSALVVAEVAMASLLVIGAGLMVRSFIRLQETDPGFQTERLLTFRMILLSSKYGPDLQRRAAFMQQTLDRIRALPMVASAASVHQLPMIGSSGTQIQWPRQRIAGKSCGVTAVGIVWFSFSFREATRRSATAAPRATPWA